MKRIAALIIAISALFALGCNRNADGGEAAEPLPTQSASATPAPTDSFCLLGMIIDDDGSDTAHMTIYGFLHTAQTLGYASKVYRAAPGDEALSAVDEAKADGVDALMVFSPGGVNDAAVTAAKGNGMFVAAPYFECSAGADVNVVADESEYYDELARGLAERMTERSLKSGRILVYGRDTAKCLEMFELSINEYYPQFRVVAFERTAMDEQGAIDELAAFILVNRDIKGMYVVDSDASAIAVSARSAAQKTFRTSGAPEPTPVETPAQTLAPDATPEYVPNPNLLKQILITIYCNGLSDSNYGLFNDNDIYALCIEPYYEAAAQGVMLLDRLVRGESVSAVTRVNRPLIYVDTADKYKAVYDQMKAYFGE